MLSLKRVLAFLAVPAVSLIALQGDPTFPVTMYIAEPTCAENVTCNSGHLTILHRNNPIEWHDLWKCVGNVSSTMFNYNFGWSMSRALRPRRSQLTCFAPNSRTSASGKFRDLGHSLGQSAKERF
jgi:hypothetical protein